MTRIEASVEVNAPLAVAFAFASEWSRWQEWWHGASDFRPTTEITRGTGTRYAYKAWIAGVSMNVETEIHDFVENTGWQGVATKGPPHRATWVFDGRGERTRFTYILEYRLPVPLLGPLLDTLFVRPGWEKILRRSLDNLKAHFEPGAPSPQIEEAPGS